MNSQSSLNKESEDKLNDNNRAPDDLLGCNKELSLIELKKDNVICRWDKLKYVFASYLSMFLFTIIKESKFIPKCSFLYWMLFLIYLVITIFMDTLSYTHILKEFEYRKSISFPYDENDIIWTYKNFISVNIIATLSGFISGVIGIGGGTILGPILLSMGLYPIISTVTTNFLVLLTSSSTSFQFIILKSLNFEYAAIGVIFSSFGSYLGTKLIHYYVKTYKKESILVFSLAFVIGISAVILPITSFSSSLNDYRNGKSIFSISSPCSN